MMMGEGVISRCAQQGWPMSYKPGCAWRSLLHDLMGCFLTARAVTSVTAAVYSIRMQGVLRRFAHGWKHFLSSIMYSHEGRDQPQMPTRLQRRRWGPDKTRLTRLGLSFTHLSGGAIYMTWHSSRTTVAINLMDFFYAKDPGN